MADLWVGEYGKTLLIETGFDLSSATGIQIYFSAPSGGIHFSTASVSVLASNVTTSACGVFSANKTLEYIIKAGNFSASTSAGAAAGIWKGYVRADFGGSKRLISTTFKFEVEMPG